MYECTLSSDQIEFLQGLDPQTLVAVVTADGETTLGYASDSSEPSRLEFITAATLLEQHAV
jgi:hypothetical protein